jgi:flavin-dependent dehydrogenase
MEKYELIIIGAGYAGLAAACQLQGRGVLLLERHGSILEKKRASLGLMLPWGEQPRLSGRKLYCPGLDLVVEDGLIARYRRLELRVGEESIRLPIDAVLVDESRLKGALLKKALAAGARLATANPVRHLVGEGRSVRVVAEKDFQARVVIGADGALGQSAHLLGQGREYQRLLYAREIVLGRLDLEQDRLLLHAGQSAALIIALSEGERCRALALQVAGVREPPADLRRELEDFVEGHGGDRVLESWTAMVPLYRPREAVCRPEFVLTGDGAAPWGMAGIGGALAAGVLAGQVGSRLLAASQFAAADYRRQWRRVTGLGASAWLGPAIIWLLTRQDKLKKAVELMRSMSSHLPWRNRKQAQEGSNVAGQGS